MIEQMPVGIALVARSGDVLLANREVARILGRDLPAQGASDGRIYTFHLDGRRYEHDELLPVRVLRGDSTIARELCEY